MLKGDDMKTELLWGFAGTIIICCLVLAVFVGVTNG